MVYKNITLGMNAKILHTTLIVLLMAIGFNTYAQTKNPSQKKEKETLHQTKVVSGNVTDWLVSSNENVVNGFYLQTNNDKLMVMFPIHMGNELRQEIIIGNAITVNGLETKDTLGVTKINMVSATIEGKTIKITAPFLPGTMPAPEMINGTAKIRELQKNINGKISGYILDNKTILRVTSNISNELTRMLVAGTTISYIGIKSDAGSGEDAWSTYTIILCQSIIINNKQFLTD